MSYNKTIVFMTHLLFELSCTYPIVNLISVASLSLSHAVRRAGRVHTYMPGDGSHVCFSVVKKQPMIVSAEQLGP
jgi:hypothetical protein